MNLKNNLASKKDVIVQSGFLAPVVIYLVAFAMTLYYNLTYELVNDGVWEYLAYVGNIEVGWIFRNTLVNSCVVPVWVPAMIQRATGWDQMLVFRVFPALLYPLMPMFVYLIARKYLEVRYAIVAAVVLLINSHFLFFPDIGRVGISLGFFAGLVWALLNKKMIWSIVFSVLVVFSHYNLSLIMLGMLLFVLLSYLLFKRQLLKNYLITFCLVLVLTVVWHFGVARYSGLAMLNTGLQTDVTQSGYTPSEFLLVDISDLVRIDSRSPEVQVAFGLTWVDEPVPIKIEILANWAMVALVTVGLYALWKNRTINFQFKSMAVSLYLMVCLTLFVPWLSIYHGVTRSFFISLTVLSLCVPLGAEFMARKTRVPLLVILLPLLVVYALSTSGIIYLPFGMEKTFPAVVTLK